MTTTRSSSVLAVAALVATVFLVLLPRGVGAGSGAFTGGSVNSKPCAAAAKAAAAAGGVGGKWGGGATLGGGEYGEAAATPSPAPCVELRPQHSLKRETIPIGGAPRLYALKAGGCPS
jgi:hypothetical protein